MDLRSLRELVVEALEPFDGRRDSRNLAPFDVTLWFGKAASTLGYVLCFIDREIETDEAKPVDGNAAAESIAEA